MVQELESVKCSIKYLSLYAWVSDCAGTYISELFRDLLKDSEHENDENKAKNKNGIFQAACYAFWRDGKIRKDFPDFLWDRTNTNWLTSVSTEMTFGHP